MRRPGREQPRRDRGAVFEKLVLATGEEYRLVIAEAPAADRKWSPLAVDGCQRTPEPIL
jgi:hypothetical protein